MARHNDTGMQGEAIAADYLTACGWNIVARRSRPDGLRTDIDLVALSGDGVCHFVEVKTRSSLNASADDPHADRSPAAAVTPAKARQMILAAERYMVLNHLEGEIAVDLVTVLLDRGRKSPEIRYYPDIAR